MGALGNSSGRKQCAFNMPTMWAVPPGVVPQGAGLRATGGGSKAGTHPLPWGLRQFSPKKDF